MEYAEKKESGKLGEATLSDYSYARYYFSEKEIPDVSNWTKFDVTNYGATPNDEVTDKAVGSIIDKMKELDIMENAIFVFTSDHGEMMGSHGERPYKKQVGWDESIKVPFLISYPNIGDNKGAVVNAPIK